METFEQVAEKAGLEGRTRDRYLAYMRARWADKESLQCKTGYALEWAQRFKQGIEYGASDSLGQCVLKDIDGEQG